MIFRVLAIKKPYFSHGKILQQSFTSEIKTLKKMKSLRFILGLPGAMSVTIVKFQTLWLKECFDLPLF